MWNQGWRDEVWSRLDQDWDLIVIGGGITGAGVFREAVSRGLKVLLLEAHDFSFGTSSRSSKLVHGGFRYLRNGQIDVTRESVREREWMLRKAPNLVTPLPFFMPSYRDSKTPAWQFGVGVILYDILAPKWQHRKINHKNVQRHSPLLNTKNLRSVYEYYDARVDDSRLVLRIIQDTVAAGGCALNYARVENLLRRQDGTVCGVAVSDSSGLVSRTQELKARVVINAAGPWSDDLRSQIGAPPRLRRLRGSHLVFTRQRFPLDQAVTLLHPKDNRAMFAIPWEGVTLVGTTDLDHGSLQDGVEPYADCDEVEYILDVIHATFPAAEITENDIISSFAGLRPIINTGKANPSQESRAHVVWDEDGLITITGGKLTTFRIMAREALQKASPRLPEALDFSRRFPMFDPLPELGKHPGLELSTLAYLSGRYGAETAGLLDCAAPDETRFIDPLPNLWAEIRWAARAGGVVHLDDLLLRRVRLGLLLPEGGLDEEETIRRIIQPELGWDDARWKNELMRYREIWTRYYSPVPAGDSQKTSGG